MTIVQKFQRVALVMGLVTGLVCAVCEQPAGAASTRAKEVVPLHADHTSSVNQEKPSVSRTSQQTLGKGTGRRFLQKGRRKEPSSDRGLSKRGQGKGSRQGGAAGVADKVSRSLAYHGILEQPQRYDFGRKSKGAVLNPEARELLIDHFQELDRNRDGVLDPLERAVGRLDIERDMNHR